MDQLAAAFGPQSFDVQGVGAWPSRFAVTELATRCFGAVGSALGEVMEATGLGPRPAVTVDRRLASLWYSWSIHPQGWQMPGAWDPIAGDYAAADGWIRLHTNAPHHRDAALSVLGCAAERSEVAEALRGWQIDALEAAVVGAGGAAAAMRDRDAWLAHPQGAAVAAEPLVHWATRTGALRDFGGTRARPLAGLRVLDLTRVLAGPMATRALAGFGAEVLRIDPPSWSEPGVVPDVTLGKTCAHLDLKQAADRARFEALLAGADVLVHGYRPGALDAMVSPARRLELAPNLIEVSLCAYGWTGPWAARRGFDSLVQMSCGIAEAGMGWAGADKPHPLPVQALDHATGYLMAASVLSALARAARGEGVSSARLSLARTAELLCSLEKAEDGPAITGSTPDDLSDWEERTPWGPARRLKPALSVEGAPMRWGSAACDLGSSPAAWR
ncbi:CoA transferase [Ruegeria pomeroyi]|nr:CoA transferase [Ruegeria pomeroyi]